MKFISLFWIFILLFFNSFCLADESYRETLTQTQNYDYDDPFAMYQQQKTLDGLHETTSSSNSQNYNTYCKDTAYELFARRLINIIVSKSNFKINQDGFVTGKLELQATKDQFHLIRSFGEGKISFKQIDDIINNVIRSEELSSFDKTLDYAEILFLYLYHNRVVIGASLSIILIAFIAIKVNWTRKKVIWLIVDTMVVTSFILTWLQLIQENEIKLLAQQKMYPECTSGQLGVTATMLMYIGNYLGIGQGNCLKHIQSVMTDSTLVITPLLVLSHMTTKFFSHPLSIIGHYLGEFVQNITEPLPFPFSIIAKLVLIFLVVCLFSTIIITYIGGGWGIKLGPLFHIYLHGRQNNSSARSHQRIEEIHEAPALLPSMPREALTNAVSESPLIASINKSSRTPSSFNESNLSRASIVSINKPKQSLLTCNIDFTDDKMSKSENLNNTSKREEISDTTSSQSDESPELKDFEKVSRIKLVKEMTESDDNMLLKDDGFKTYKKRSRIKYKTKIKNQDLGDGDN